MHTTWRGVGWGAGKIVVVGGMDSMSSAANSSFVYDIYTRTWGTISAAPTRQWKGGAATINGARGACSVCAILMHRAGVLMAFGGEPFTTAVQAYSLTADSWEAPTSLGTLCSAFSVASVDGA